MSGWPLCRLQHAKIFLRAALPRLLRAVVEKDLLGSGVVRASPKYGKYLSKKYRNFDEEKIIEYYLLSVKIYLNIGGNAVYLL